MAKHEIPVVEPPFTQRDDLELIRGIGPGIEKRLYDAGIYRYDDLASMTPAEVLSSIGEMIGLTVKRVEDQDWIGQARKLAPEVLRGQANGKAGRQHYATFTFELLLDEGNNVRRTRAAYIQGEAEETWAGWDPGRLLGFVAQKSGVHTETPQDESVRAGEMSESEMQQPLVLAGNLRLAALRFISLQTGRQSRILPDYQPFTLSMTVDLGELIVPVDTDVDYAANVYAKELGHPAQQLVGGASGVVDPLKNLDVTFDCEGLKRGMYRLQVSLTLSLRDHDEPVSQQAPFLTLLDGGLLKIY